MQITILCNVEVVVAVMSRIRVYTEGIKTTINVESSPKSYLKTIFESTEDPLRAHPMKDNPSSSMGA